MISLRHLVAFLMTLCVVAFSCQAAPQFFGGGGGHRFGGGGFGGGGFGGGFQRNFHRQPSFGGFRGGFGGFRGFGGFSRESFGGNSFEFFG